MPITLKLLTGYRCQAHMHLSFPKLYVWSLFFATLTLKKPLISKEKHQLQEISLSLPRLGWLPPYWCWHQRDKRRRLPVYTIFRVMQSLFRSSSMQHVIPSFRTVCSNTLNRRNLTQNAFFHATKTVYPKIYVGFWSDIATHTKKNGRTCVTVTEIS